LEREGKHEFFAIRKTRQSSFTVPLGAVRPDCAGLLGFPNRKGSNHEEQGIGAPLLIAVVWGTFGSPAAPLRLSISSHLILELVVFELPAIALYTAGNLGLAWTYGLVVVINRALMYVWRQ
jgi:hypothetical protein